MLSRRVLVLPALVVILAACSGNGSGSSPAGASEPASSAAATRIEVELSDSLKITPNPMAVPAGVPVTFVVHNGGSIEHEFVLGDEATQAEHEMEMAEGGMDHDEENAISVDPGATKELTFTFDEAGETFAGCHVPGHYPAGMKATITVGS
jgi:uncharacterized cupredoxin-like copper-binding protein